MSAITYRAYTKADEDAVIAHIVGIQQGECVRRWPNLMASVAVFRFENR